MKEVKQRKFVSCDENYVKHANDGEVAIREEVAYISTSRYPVGGRVMWSATLVHPAVVKHRVALCLCNGHVTRCVGGLLGVDWPRGDWLMQAT